MRNVLMVLLTAALLGGAGVGCEGRTHEENVCLDTVHQLSSAYEGCGYDYAATREQLLGQLRDCEGVVAIRDEDQLYDECFPELAVTSCVDLEAGTVPVACHDQILF